MIGVQRQERLFSDKGLGKIYDFQPHFERSNNMGLSIMYSHYFKPLCSPHAHCAHFQQVTLFPTACRH